MSDDQPAAVADGGPLDGSVLATTADPAEFEIVMQDNSRWRYVRTERRTMTDAGTAQIYQCTGRIQS